VANVMVAPWCVCGIQSSAIVVAVSGIGAVFSPVNTSCSGRFDTVTQSGS
jgi:hypothetical protein